MITESKVTEIFCISDDFRNEFEVEMPKTPFRHHPRLQNAAGSA